MAKVLSRYQVERALKELRLGAAERNALEIAHLLGEDGRVLVADVHRELFPMSSVSSANTTLRRVVGAINEAASAAGRPFKACVSPNKKAGAEKRWVWFEGPDQRLPVPDTPDLAGIEPNSLIEAPPGRLLSAPVVLISFNRHEVQAVREEFKPDAQPKRRGGVTYWDLGRHGGVDVYQVVSGQGQENALVLAQQVCQVLRPRAVMAVGIAFGLSKGKQSLGDVLVSLDVYGYESRRVNADGTTTPRGVTRDATPALVGRIRSLDLAIGSEGRITWPKLHFGCLLSGSALVDDPEFKRALAAQHPGAIGGEMEGSAVARAAREHGVDWIVVKGVSDWGDGGKADPREAEHQATAARQAAQVVREAIQLGGWEDGLRGAEFGPGPREPGGAGEPDRTWGSRHAQRQRWPNPIPELEDLEKVTTLIPDQRGVGAVLDKKAAPAGQVEAGSANSSWASGTGLDAHQTLLNWAGDKTSRRCFALLGEYGMGKTIACQRLVKAVLERREADPSWPVPLYFDLRRVTSLKQRVPTVDEVMKECAEAGWQHQGDLELCSVTSIREWINGGALVVFDGLDEVLVKLNQQDGAEFTRRLLSLAPAPGGPADTGAKVLISSRTQYFRTLTEERNHFTGEERGDKPAQVFDSLLLLPFTDSQVIQYLRAVLPDSDAKRLLESVNSVHNLSELAHRPVTLRFIAPEIRQIALDQAQGREVHASTIYRMTANRWFDRDLSKSHIKRREDKLTLAAHLAAHLWRESARGKPSSGADEARLAPLALEDWLHAWLASRPALARRYGHLDPELLEEDLRNTTFLRRVDLDADRSVFQFAHTSLQEFFFAEYLIAGLREDQPEHWAMPSPSPETLDFLGQSLAEADDRRPLLET
ncbi:MAG: NACHT domain-containing protein, partial [Bifidobacteriaceae bacterium]|nr:NACHT domain-containing protein [Bifidobacteriaceae bacterium]